ncbi:hypothetical protein D3C72_1752070 [compost metagenome]
MSTPAAPRNPLSSATPRNCSSIPRACCIEHGAMAATVSCITSTITPPSPTTTSAPRCGSTRAPTRISIPAGTWLCTSTPLMQSLMVTLRAFAITSR